jgi:hypothetical protein
MGDTRANVAWQENEDLEEQMSKSRSRKTKKTTHFGLPIGAPAIRGPIKDSYLSFLPTRVH